MRESNEFPLGDRVDWRVKVSVEPKTGQISRQYLYRGSLAGRVVLDSKLAEQLAGYSLIEKDLRNALEWFGDLEQVLPELGIENVTEPEYMHVKDPRQASRIKGLLVAAVTIYAKCFADAKGRRIKLERTNIAREHQGTHDEITSIRHNFAAHSGEEALEYAQVVLVVTLEKESGQYQICTELQQPGSISLGDIEKYKALINHVRGYVVAKQKELSALIMTREVVPKGPLHWQERTTK